MSPVNLHNLSIAVDGEKPQQLKNHSVEVKSPHFETLEVIFKDQESKLLEKIKAFEKGAIFGCVAWLTSVPVLRALGKCQNVQIIVQKEDFLRPDIGVRNLDRWKSELWKLYRDIKCDLERHDFREPMCNLSICGDPTVEGIRCVGNHNLEKTAAFPRAHHKFLVFCNIVETEAGPEYIPISLWTGSFNITKNATQSFENVLYFTDTTGKNPVINAFLDEHHQIYALSETLNWTSEWSAPEYRIGT